MRRPLIAIALLAAFVAQLVLSGASAACAMPSTEEMAARAGTGSPMTAMAMAHQREHESRAPRGGEGSCDTTMPAAVCQLMSACTAPAVTIAASTALALPHSTSDAIPFVRTSPPLRSTAPELPPPRA